MIVSMECVVISVWFVFASCVWLCNVVMVCVCCVVWLLFKHVL